VILFLDLDALSGLKFLWGKKHWDKYFPTADNVVQEKGSQVLNLKMA
jgi:hypothetical protein